MRIMNVSLLWALLVCAPLTLAAQASASSEDGSPSATVANMRAAAGRAATTRDSSSKAVSPRRGSVMPQRGIGRAAGGNAGRLPTRLNAQARGRVAPQRGRLRGSTRAASGGPVERSSQGVGAVGAPKLAVSNHTPSPVPNQTAIPRASALGGPHVQSVGRLGGPVIGRTNHNAVINGTELRRKSF